MQLQIQPSYSFQETPAISPFNTGPNGVPNQIVTAGASAGITGLTSSGGRINASTSAQRIDNNNLYDTYNPYYQTALQLTYSQPLARGRAIDEVREQIQLSRIDSQQASDSALLTASTTINNVSVAYDNLVSAWKNVGIEEDALRQAQAQSESNARLSGRGQSAPVDVIQSDQQVSEFQYDVFAAVQSVASAQNQIKQLILGDPSDAVWRANLVPTTPIGVTPPEPAVEDVLLAALKNRPEIAQLRDNLRSQDVRVAYDKDQTLPQIDLNIGVTENGFAGNEQSLTGTPLFSVIGAEITSINALIARANAAAPGLPPLVPISGAALATPLTPNSVGNIGTAYRSALAFQYPQYQISATLGLPLTNKVARANYEASVERRNALVVQEVGLVQRLQTESRNAVQLYRSAIARLNAASSARVAAERVEQSEVRRFKAGVSTTYLVLQRQVMLANERNRELQAQTDVQNALVEIDRVSGNIIAKNNVDVRETGVGTPRSGTGLVEKIAGLSALGGLEERPGGYLSHTRARSDQMRGIMLMAVAAAAVAVPMAVLADPPAVTAPMMPAVFNGAPRNDNPDNGQFSVNFDDQGRYLGTGTAPQHLGDFDLAPARAIRQASAVSRPSEARQSAVNAVFVTFQQRLRENRLARRAFAGITLAARA